VVNEDNAAGTLVPAVGRISTNSTNTFSAAGPSNANASPTHGKSSYVEGIDYEEVFAPVARIKAIRLFLAYASFMGFMVYQMDVKSAFLYGTIEEEVYVCQPPGFEDPDYPNKFYKVVKVIMVYVKLLELVGDTAAGSGCSSARNTSSAGNRYSG
nr:putative ribonuclease H-like domain-containing protein [Tanacetum cinerariifolium]